MIKRLITRSAIGIACLLAVAAVNGGAEELLHARVSYSGGGGLVKGTSDADWSYATINTLILPGDVLWADQEGAVELEFSGGTFLRMADQSKAEVVRLAPSPVIRGWTGSFYLQRIRRSTNPMIFETPACKIEVSQDTQARIDVIGDGATTLSVRWGHATVRAEAGGAVSVTSGMRTYIDPGYLASAPAQFDRGFEDDFDAWNRERARLLAVGSQPLPAAVSKPVETIGTTDLAAYGEWVYVDDNPYWRPTTVVNYVPYRSGHWSYVPSSGYVWVGDYPFSYVTSHYGRWSYNDHHGWLWCYDDVWSPAWVATVRYGPNFVWCPIDPYGRPVVVGGYYDVGGVRFGYGASTYCSADRLLGGYYSPYDPFTPSIYRGSYGGDVYIWNINIGDDDHGRHHDRNRRPYLGSHAQVRDYSPRRVIRGPDTVSDNLPRASVRSGALERNAGRKGFDSPRARAVSNSRSLRTTDPKSLSVRQRRVSVKSQTVSEMRTLARNTERRATSVGRGSLSSGRMSARGGRDADEWSPAWKDEARRERMRRETSGTSSSTNRSHSARVGGSHSSRLNSNGASHSGRIREPGNDVLNNESATTRERSRNFTSLAPDRSRVTTPDSPSRESLRNRSSRSMREPQSPNAPKAPTAPRSIDTSRSGSRSLRSSPSRSLRSPTSALETPAPSPRVTSPSRIRTPNTTVTPPAPSRSTPSARSRSWQSRSSSSSRSGALATPSPRTPATPAPARSVPSTPSPSFNTRSRSSSSRMRSSAPSISARPPSRSPSRNVAAPSRSSGSRAPSHSPSRNVTAPSRSSGSRAPSHSPSRNISSPSRSSGSRSSISSGSRSSGSRSISSGSRSSGARSFSRGRSSSRRGR